MDTCSNSCEKSHRRERVKEERVSRKKIREEKESEKKEEEERMIKVREPVGESRNTVFSQRFVAPEGRQVGSLKQQVRSHMAG
jgi:predicted RecB family nuclease